MIVVNKIMIGIVVLCLLLCGGILVFALNPDMTSSLAQKLYGNTVDMPPGTEETGEGQTSGNGNISVTLPNGMPGEMNGYVAPSMDQMQIPGMSAAGQDLLPCSRKNSRFRIRKHRI